VPLIRPAAREDAEDIARLCVQLGYPATAVSIRPTLDVLLRNEGVTVDVATESGVICGLMQVSIHRAIESGAWAEIDALVVDESQRGRGIGRALVEYARTWAREEGLARLRVRTNEKRTDAHAFYERLGFTHVKSQRIYDTPINAEPQSRQSR
jgi:GNAT superfamily N-acetyltransferase